MVRRLGNPALYSFLALAITLCAAIPAGYALAMTEFRVRHALLVTTLVVMLMPNATLVVPLFLTNYFLPYVLLSTSETFPVQVGLAELLNNVPQFNPTIGEFAVQLALATLLAISPVVVVFLFSQRFLVAGMLTGATRQ